VPIRLPDGTDQSLVRQVGPGLTFTRGECSGYLAARLARSGRAAAAHAICGYERAPLLGHNGVVTERPPDRFRSEPGQTGWFAFEPAGSHIKEDDEDPVIRVVTLRSDEHAGPFWDDEGYVSDEFEELQRWIGISRALFDDAMAWNDEFASSPTAERDAEWQSRHSATRQDLLRRLRREVHPGIEVPDSA